MAGVLCLIGGWVLLSLPFSHMVGTLLYKLGRFDL